MASKEQKVVEILLSDIYVDPTWNSRSGDITIDGTEDSNSFKELVSSIRASGGVNKDACKVRPKGNAGKVGLVAGFRRVAAIKAIAEADGNKTPVVRCIIEEMDELVARQENVRENVARSDMKAADKAWSLLDIEKQLKLKKVEPTDMMITDSVGMNQSYGNKLLRIGREVPEPIFQDWRNSKLPLTVPEMVSVVKVGPDKALMKRHYEELTAKKQPRSGKDKAKLYVEGLVSKAEKIATLLGNLEREELISTDNLVFADHITHIVKFKKDSTPAQFKKVALAAEKAYNDALTATPSEEGEDDED